MQTPYSPRRGVQDALDRVFETAQLIERSREEVFSFFATPENLEAITPPWLRFRMVSRTTPDVRKGTELKYRIKIHGIPVTWRSRITVWEPGRRFVDEQIRGPYSVWRHTHEFEELSPERTLVRDRVIYRLPMGRLGAWIGGSMVARDIAKIFLFRGDRIFDLLDPSAGTLAR